MQDGRYRSAAAVPAAGALALTTLLGALLLGSGCATSQLDAARGAYFNGDYARAEAALTNMPAGDTDKVLLLMERGMIRQARGNYEGSVRDWGRASDVAEQLDYLSLSRETASFAVNDTLLPFLGAPYERVLMHAHSAKSYMAMNLWDDAAVEGRRVIRYLQDRDGFPDDPYSRYVTGLALELQGDGEGARFQYDQAAKLLSAVALEPDTGRLAPAGPAAEAPRERGATELICFVAIGRIPSFFAPGSDPHDSLAAPYAEIRSGGQLLGRSYPLANTGKLMAETQARVAAIKAAKTAARIVVKEAAAEALEQQNEFLGEMLRMVLFALEVQDTRHWETLPHWLEVARVPCPPDLRSYTVVFRDANGRTLEMTEVTAPLARHGRTIVSFCRTQKD